MLRLASHRWKVNSIGWGDLYLVEQKFSRKPLITDFGCLTFWSVEILVANVVETTE